VSGDREGALTGGYPRLEMRRHRRHSRRRIALMMGAGVCFEALALRMRSGRLAGNVPVRCRHGHLFTTIWIPGASLKAFRLGWWRFQWCPVGRHWSIVTPVRESELDEAERRAAAAAVDLRIP
jgi:hypothetical protein